MNILILYSGGLDSRIMEQYAKVNYPEAKITKVWFDIGQEYSEKELACLDSSVEIRSIDYLKGISSVGKDGNACGNIMIPGRNAVLALLAASIYLPDEIWMGALKGEDNEGATDKNFTFVYKFNELANYVLSPYKDKILLRFPLAEANMGKFESVEWALNNGLTKEDLLKTSSCLSGEEGNCGTCIVCVRRWGIFSQLGIKEKYNRNWFDSEDSINYLLNVLKDDGHHYDDYRKREVIPALKNYFDIETDYECEICLKLLKEKN